MICGSVFILDFGDWLARIVRDSRSSLRALQCRLKEKHGKKMDGSVLQRRRMRIRIAHRRYITFASPRHQTCASVTGNHLTLCGGTHKELQLRREEVRSQGLESVEDSRILLLSRACLAFMCPYSGSNRLVHASTCLMRAMLNIVSLQSIVKRASEIGKHLLTENKRTAESDETGAADDGGKMLISCVLQGV
jgi:hypothetical protein